MIIKGNPAGNVGFWTKHLQNDSTNERAEVVEISGLLADDLESGLREMEAVASGSRSHGNFMYQANISPRTDEQLTPEQWKQAVDTLEENLGLEGHQRIVIEHEKRGEDGELRTHRHVVWNRVDVDTMKVADMGGNWLINEQTARQLEQAFDLTPSPTPSRARDKEPPLELWEIRAAERSGITPAEVRAEVTELWQSTQTGLEFADALEDRGYILARGDRRDFCIIDQAGDVHSLARRLEGVQAKDARERMQDVDRDALPTVAEARQAQRGLARTELEPAHVEAERATMSPAEKRFQHRWRRSADAEISRVADPIDAKTPYRFSVANAATGMAESLADFVSGLLAGEDSQPKRSPAEIDQFEQIKAQRRALAAIENIRESMERGERLRPEDLHNLTPTHLENIRLRGDDYMRELIEQAERDRNRWLDHGREREL